jgi:PAS domain-containing protein
MSPGHPVIEAAGPPPHEVQLYGADERFLAANVGRYIRDGLNQGEGVVVFAVPQHSEAFARAAMASGVDVESAIRRQQLIFADAGETLAAFMADGQIDSARFERVIRQAVRNVRPLPEHTGGRAYGEMVGLLWTAGKFQQAIELEEQWNTLLASIGLRLFCAYPIDIFGADLNSSPVAAVLHAHTHILSTGEDGDLERALSRAVSDFAASDAGAWRAAPPSSASGSTVTIPSAETTILSLRSEASESAGQIVARARHYYQTEKRFRALIENSSDGILLLDASGKIGYASASAARVLGQAPQEMVGSNAFEGMHPDDQGHARYLFAMALTRRGLPFGLKRECAGSMDSGSGWTAPSTIFWTSRR